MSFPPLSLRLKIGMFFLRRAEVWGLQLGAACQTQTPHVPQKEKPFKVVKQCKLLVCCGYVTNPAAIFILWIWDVAIGWTSQMRPADLTCTLVFASHEERKFHKTRSCISWCVWIEIEQGKKRDEEDEEKICTIGEIGDIIAAAKKLKKLCSAKR